MFCFVFIPTIAKCMVGDDSRYSYCHLKCLDPWLFGQLCIVILVITLSPCVCVCVCVREREKERERTEEGRRKGGRCGRKLELLKYL